jgi:hypothetical protein
MDATELKKIYRLQDQLGKFIESIKSRSRAFEVFTSETIKKVKGTDKKNIKKFVKNWFRTFIGILDECLVLINGELIREYHQKEHESFVHSRGKEAHYYKTNSKVTACSVDGIDFEYRALTHAKKKLKIKVSVSAAQIGMT